ncbi:hypothetical protein MNBD_GAMMA06-1496 [hydrothermal vent metagenome]|uniref:AAA+ ATPase domain-containing protein n=1 Tax=hydrothermal vent metagenome TaxID=652676 RepID=A0A3B0X1J3_9ZZZZ
MYEAFYGFKEKPFSMLPDPDFLYLSKKHQAALTLLEYGLLNHVGFCVVSGEAGAGKTTILRALLERVEDNITIGLITNTHQSFGGLLDWVLSAFDLHKPNLTHVEMHQVFMEYLIEEYAKGNTVLLIVDEAQNMNPDALEELRMLSNVNSEKDQLMQVVLAGQPALKDTLRLPELMQFAQRVAVDYHLDPLNLEETCGYIQHRLIIAGAQKDVFTPAACQRIHNYSGGTPRLINLLCETVLVYGFADQQEVIDIDLVDEMVLERMKDSVVPIVNRDIAKQGNKNIDEILVKNFPSINPAEKGVVRERLAKEKSVKEEVKIATTNKVEPEKIAKKIVVENKKKEEIKDKKKESQEKGALEKGALEKGALEKRGLEKRGQGKEAQKKAPSEKIEQPSSQSSTSAASEKNTGAMIDSVLFSAESGDSAGISEDSRGAKKQIIKYGAFAVVAAAVFIVIALMFGGEKAIFVVIPDVVENASKNMVKNSSKEAMLQKEHEQAELEKKRALEEKQLRQAQMEAETLKKESEEAIAKAEKEKLAAEKAARAEKAAAKKRRLAEEKRADTAKRSARKAKQEAAKAKEETAQLKREAEKLEEQRRVMKARLDEEWRLKRQLERERAIELDKLEIQRLELEENASQAAATAAEVSAAEKAAEQSKSADCSGPTARFKSGCR